ncbi:PD-(D/E)XK motif protein [Actinoplanes subglobosus]|uniref:PD-(D/E)XK motif protein n=1 Tax=Actinoplanes subglobosus TaxID=1547892 RepID=A0ABV8IS44_9ACTN
MISDHWAALCSARHNSGWLTSEVPVLVAGMPLLCALSPERRRHLLVPVPPADYARADTRAAAVHLLPLTLEAAGVRVEYASLVLLRDDLLEIFTGLCADVVAALAVGPAEPIVVVAQVLDGWRELFRSGSQLGVEQLAGLFGELRLLNALLDRDASLLGAWRGPLRSPHDFVANRKAVEVKATTAPEGRSVRIHGLDQLAAPENGDLMLQWMRLDTSDPAGISLPEIVDSTVRRVGRPQELLQLLARVGYFTADRHIYDGVRFAVVEEACYLVVESFPRIVTSAFVDGVPVGISGVRYTLDLDVGPAPMQKEDIEQFLQVMAER